MYAKISADPNAVGIIPTGWSNKVIYKITERLYVNIFTN